MKKGLLVLGTAAIITGITWVLTPPIYEFIPFVALFSQFIGALSLLGFAFTFFISTRHPFVDEMFNGLDKAYIAHKWIGIGSIALAIAHVVILVFGQSMELIGSGFTPFGLIGRPSMLLFVILALAAIFAKKMNYENWKSIHKFMILPYIIGLVHYYGASTYIPFGFNLFSIFMNIVNIIGIISAFYAIFVYERTAFRFKYKVSSVQTVAHKTLEITGKAIGEHISHQPGQFTFFKIQNESIKFPSHPFTISTASKADIIQFTIKNLGDHTAKLADTIKTDDVFSVTAPHGRFDYTKGGKHQIWIAGGIGIAPFRSFYQATIPEHFSIDFFYAYTGEEGAYLDELRALDKSNLRVYLNDSREQGRLTAEKIQDKINAETPVDIYFCGPKTMRDSLRKGLQSSNVQMQAFHFEEFEFGR